MPAYIPPEIRGKKLKETVELDCRHSADQSIEMVFYVKTLADVVKVAPRIAMDETTGAWIGKGKPTEVFERAVAQVYRVERYGKNEGIIYIRSPLYNVDLKSDPLYQLLMLAVGGPVLEWAYYTDVAFLDFTLPPRMLKKFPGPQFGIEGVRKLIGLEKGRPVIGTIVKPCAGLTVKEVARKCYEAALGGATFIKDDEKMMSPAYCPFEDKIKAVAEALAKARAKTGLRCLYAPQIVARADRLLERSARAVELGADALMFNAVLAHTPEALSILASSREVRVPLYAHSGGRSALSTGPRRIDDAVIVKLIRLSGGDFFQHGVYGVKQVHVASEDETLLANLARVMQEPLGTLRDTIPVTAGGLGAANLGLNLSRHKHPRLGYAVAALAGTNVLNHPDGPAAGATAMNQAASAYFDAGVTEAKALADYARKKGLNELSAILGGK